MKIGGLDLLRGTSQNGLDLFQGGVISQAGRFQRRHGCFFPILIQHGIYQTVVWPFCTGPLQLFYTDTIQGEKSSQFPSGSSNISLVDNTEAFPLLTFN